MWKQRFKLIFTVTQPSEMPVAGRVTVVETLLEQMKKDFCTKKFKVSTGKCLSKKYTNIWDFYKSSHLSKEILEMQLNNYTKQVAVKIAGYLMKN